MANSLALPYPVETTNPVPVVKSYGPWASVAAACAGVLQGVRHDGLTVMVTGTGEYWWLQSDLSDNGLVLKSPSGNGSGGSGTPLVDYAFSFPVQTDGAQSFALPAGTAGIFSLQAQTEYGVLRPLSPSHYQLSGGNLVITADASLKDGELVEGKRYTGGSTGASTGGGTVRDYNNVPSAVQNAVTATGHTWQAGDLTAYATSAQQTAATTGVVKADFFDAFETGNATSAYRYTYCLQNNGSLGWTRLPKAF